MVNKFYGNMKLAQKLGVAFCFVLVPLIITIIFLSSAAMNRVDFASKEVEGIHVVVALQKLVQNIAIHRGVSSAYLSGEENYFDQLATHQQNIEDNFKLIETVLAENASIAVASNVESIRNDWQSLLTNNLDLLERESIDAHSAIIDKLIDLIVNVADISNLTLDPNLDSYYLMSAVTIDIPNLANRLGIMRAFGTSILSTREINSETKILLNKHLVAVEIAFDNLKQGRTTIFKANPELRSELSLSYDKAIQAANTGLGLIKNEILEPQQLSYFSEPFFNQMTQSIDSIYNLTNALSPALEKLLNERVSQEKTLIYTELAIIAILVLAGCSLGYFVINQSVSSLKTSIKIFKKIEEGNLDNKISSKYKDEIGQLIQAIASMQTTLKDKNNEVGRLVSAVKGMSNSIMMADVDGNINYTNPAIESMFRKREDELKNVFPSFSVDNLVGSNFDIFHKNPHHQRQILRPENLPHKASIEVAGLYFELTAVALLDERGEFLGTAVEWVDTTDLVQAQLQVEALIADAGQGKLDNRLDTEAFEGFMRNLADGINIMLDTVVEPIENCQEVLQALSKGDLKRTMEGNFHGLFEELQKSINTSIENLRNMVGEIVETSSHVSSSAIEISQGNADLSQRTEEQASSLEETASSMEELTCTVKENADAATKANKLSHETMLLAETGGKVVSEAIGAMKDIDDASREISDIISVIDEIAFQTNLLALNAAVEAARAGDQGRGFAVVAAEVRNLAQRSASAAKEIKLLINNSVSKVDLGSQLVNDSGEKLNDIVGAVKNVTSLVSDISNASEEQASGIQQINQAITQMDSMTQQNSALVEEAAASAESLSEQANNLMELMSFFETGKESGQLTNQPPIRRKPDSHTEQTSQRSIKVSLDDEWEEF